MSEKGETVNLGVMTINLDKYKCKKCGFVLPGIGLKFFGEELEKLGLKRDYCLACLVRAYDELGIGQVEKVEDETL